MTISSTTRKAGPFTGTGTVDTFPFTFKVFEAADLDVVQLNVSTSVETTLALTTDYTVALNQDQDANPGGSITLVAGNLASGYTLVVSSDVANLQPTDLTNQGGFYPEVINDALDRSAIQIQQLQEKVDRSAKLPITSTADADALVADIVRIADSTDIINTVANNIADVTTVSTDIDNVNTVAGSQGNVNTVAGSIANVNTTATNITDVNTVAAEIGAGQDVTVVASNMTSVTAVANNSTNINTVAGSDANVTTVATNIANVNTTAASISSVNIAANNITGVNAVAAEIGTGKDVTVVADNIGDVNTCATNIAAIIAAPGYASDAAASAAAAAANATYENLSANGDIGTGADQVAQGNHNHSGVYEPADSSILKTADIDVMVQGYDPATVYTDTVQTFTAAQRGAVTTDNDLSFDMSVGNNFTCTVAGTGTLTFTNITAGQSGNIFVNNSGGYAISAASTTLISSADLTKLSTAGSYWVSYYSADGTNVNVAVSPALTAAGA